ncbi:MAG: hypothetical protein COB29_14740, partial [Sulfitobacter sp.]
TANTGTLTFLSGETSKTMTIVTGDDTAEEADETLIVALSNPVDGVISIATAIGTIFNDDSINTAIFSISDASAVEGSYIYFTVTRSGRLDGDAAVRFSTADGTATVADNDYTAFSGWVVFRAGETSKTGLLATGNDTVDEADETLTVTLSYPYQAIIAVGTATGTIIDND